MSASKLRVVSPSRTIVAETGFFRVTGPCTLKMKTCSMLILAGRDLELQAGDELITTPLWWERYWRTLNDRDAP